VPGDNYLSGGENESGRKPFLSGWNKIKRQKKWRITVKDGGPQKWSNTSSFIPTSLLSVFVVLMAVASLWAQTATTGNIAGIVTDPSTAVVAGVPITLKNVDTGSSTSTTTNAQGSYNFSLLQPGHYSVTTSAAGFQAISRNVTVLLGASTTVNLQLSLSSQNESLEVTDQITGVQTEDANLETNFNAQQIAVLPNPGNDLSAVALTAAAQQGRER
jgi:hypothetical protein